MSRSIASRTLHPDVRGATLATAGAAGLQAVLGLGVVWFAGALGREQHTAPAPIVLPPPPPEHG
jgi:hypothetical protein